MELNIATYNMEWMVKLFDTGGNLKTDADSVKRATQLADKIIVSKCLSVMSSSCAHFIS